MKQLWWARPAQFSLLVVWACIWLVQGCGPGPGYGVRPKHKKLKPMQYKEFSPILPENNIGASGRAEGVISRDQPRFRELVQNFNPDIVFKDEEDTGADRVMTRRCKDSLNRLAIAVMNQWPGVRLRVTEAWDEDGNHPKGSLHYEGRAVDITTDDKDTKKYGLLAQLAMEAGFDWVHYESKHRIHCSVKSDNSVTVERGGCFPGWALVTVPGGRQKTLSSLTSGDRIMALSETGQVVYSRVLLFLHREQESWSTFLFLETEDGNTLSLTPDHLVFLDSHCRNDINEYQAQFASRAKTGDCVLISRAGGPAQPSKVISITAAESEGVYAPLTEAGTLFVDGVLASSYAVVEDHRLAHWAFGPLRMFYSLRQLLWGEKAKEERTSDSQRAHTENAAHCSNLTAKDKAGMRINNYNIYKQGNVSEPCRMEIQEKHSSQGMSDVHWYARLLHGFASNILDPNLFHL